MNKNRTILMRNVLFIYPIVFQSLVCKMQMAVVCFQLVRRFLQLFFRQPHHMQPKLYLLTTQITQIKIRICIEVFTRHHGGS